MKAANKNITIEEAAMYDVDGKYRGGGHHKNLHKLRKDRQKWLIDFLRRKEEGWELETS